MTMTMTMMMTTKTSTVASLYYNIMIRLLTIQPHYAGAAFDNNAILTEVVSFNTRQSTISTKFDDTRQ